VHNVNRHLPVSLNGVLAMLASAAATVGQCQRLHLVVESSFLARSRLTSYCAQQAYITSNARASQISDNCSLARSSGGL